MTSSPDSGVFVFRCDGFWSLGNLQCFIEGGRCLELLESGWWDATRKSKPYRVKGMRLCFPGVTVRRSTVFIVLWIFAELGLAHGSWIHISLYYSMAVHNKRSRGTYHCVQTRYFDKVWIVREIPNSPRPGPLGQPMWYDHLMRRDLARNVLNSLHAWIGCRVCALTRPGCLAIRLHIR